MCTISTRALGIRLLCAPRGARLELCVSRGEGRRQARGEGGRVRAGNAPIWDRSDEGIGRWQRRAGWWQRGLCSIQASMGAHEGCYAWQAHPERVSEGERADRRTGWREGVVILHLPSNPWVRASGVVCMAGTPRERERERRSMFARGTTPSGRSRRSDHGPLFGLVCRIGLELAVPTSSTRSVTTVRRSCGEVCAHSAFSPVPLTAERCALSRDERSIIHDTA